MEKAKEYVVKLRDTLTSSPVYGAIRDAGIRIYESYIHPRKKIVFSILGAMIFLGVAYVKLSEERVPSATVKIKMTKGGGESHKSSAKKAHQTAGEAQSEPKLAEVAPATTLPADSESFKGEQIEATGSGYLPKISAQGVTNYQAYARPVAPKALASPYKLSIVVGGLGLDSGMATTAMTDLPKDVALAFYPYAPLSHDLNTQARTQGFETLVMVPLEPMAFPKDDPGPDVLLTGLDPQENKKRLYKHLSQMTGYVGTVAYQGSRFMRSESDFTPLLKEHKDRGLIFLDPTFSRRTLSHDLGKKIKAPVLKTIFYVSSDLSDQQMETLFKKVEETLKEDGSSILYVDLNLVTLDALKKWLGQLESHQIALVPLSSQKLNKKHGY